MMIRRFAACALIRFALWLNAAADRLISIAERLLPTPPKESIDRLRIYTDASLAIRRQCVLDPLRKAQKGASA